MPVDGRRREDGNRRESSSSDSRYVDGRATDPLLALSSVSPEYVNDDDDGDGDEENSVFIFSKHIQTLYLRFTN